MDITKLFNQIQSAAPPKYIVPAAMKKAYADIGTASALYTPQIQQNINALLSYPGAGDSPQFKRLVDSYNDAYAKGAAAAMAETVAQSNANDAGYGNSYSEAAAQQAYNRYMGERGAMVPALMAQAVSQQQNDIAARANGITAMQSVQDARVKGAQALYSAQEALAAAKHKAAQQAYATQLDGLGDLYSLLTAGTSGSGRRSSGSGRRKSSSSRSGSGWYTPGIDDQGVDDTEPVQSPKKNTKEPIIEKNYTQLYNAAKAELKKQGRKAVVLTPAEFEKKRKAGMSSFNNYADYIYSIVRGNGRSAK